MLTRLSQLFVRCRLTSVKRSLTTVSSGQNKTPLISADLKVPTLNRPCPISLSETAAFLRSEIILPTANIEVGSKTCPGSSKVSSTVSILEEDVVGKDKLAPSGSTIQPKVDPSTNQNAPKQAHRMLRIRKRKMKVHQRRKRRRKNAVRYSRMKLLVAKRRECELRVLLMDKVKRAKKFNAKTYVDDYLKDVNEVLIPQTHKGKRLPTWLVKELLVKDELMAERKKSEKLDIITQQPLVLDGETVEEFVKRIEAKQWK